MRQVIMSFSPVPSFVAPETPGPFDNQELGLAWLDWAAEISGNSLARYELVLMVRPNLQLPESVKAWGKLTRFDENQGVSGWPEGPNATFKQIQWFFIHGKLKGPYLWLEPDCIPVVGDWLDLMAVEYERCGKPFMGAIVEPESHMERLGRVPRHMTGNAVYPADAYKLAPKIMEATHTCWDVLAAHQILPLCHPTTLIQHDWRRPEIRDRRELAQILRPDTALFHSDKYCAIARILRGNDPGPKRDVPIVEYSAEASGVQKLEFKQDKRVSHSLDEFPVEQILERLKTLSQGDPLLKKQIAKFIVSTGMVNRGHMASYLRKPKPETKAKIEHMSAEEFQNLIRNENAAPANAVQ